MKRIINDLRKHNQYILFASRAQLKTEVAGSKLGWVWMVLEPFCFMLVYAFVFGVIFNAAEPHHGLFIFVGLSVWQFFNRCVKRSVTVVKKNRQVIGKVYIPKYMLVLQEAYANGFKLGICILISAGMIVYYQVGVTWEVVLLVPILLLLFFLTFGISCFAMHFGVFLEDLSNIMDIVMRFLIYFVGVFYSIPNRVPFPYSDYLVRWNPVAFLVNSVRNILIYHKPIDYVAYFFWLILSLLLSYAGIQLVYKKENSYIKVV